MCLQDKLLQERHAQEWVEQEVKAGAAARAAQQDIAKRAALQWLRTTPSPPTVSTIISQLAYISQSLADLESLGPAAEQPPVPRTQQDLAGAGLPTQSPAAEQPHLPPQQQQQQPTGACPAECPVGGQDTVMHDANQPDGTSPESEVAVNGPERPDIADQQAAAVPQAQPGIQDAQVGIAAEEPAVEAGKGGSAAAAAPDLQARVGQVVADSAALLVDETHPSGPTGVGQALSPQERQAGPVDHATPSRVSPVQAQSDPPATSSLPAEASAPHATESAAHQMEIRFEPISTLVAQSVGENGSAMQQPPASAGLTSAAGVGIATGIVGDQHGAALPAQAASQAAVQGMSLLQQQLELQQQQQQQQLMWQQWAYTMSVPQLLQQLPALQQWQAQASQWGGWNPTQMPPYLNTQYLQQPAWRTAYSQGLHPTLGGLNPQGHLGGWGSGQPLTTHFGQVSNPFLGAPAAFPQQQPQAMQQGLESGGPSEPDWQPIPYGSPGRAENADPGGLIGAYAPAPQPTPLYLASLQAGTHVSGAHFQHPPLQQVQHVNPTLLSSMAPASVPASGTPSAPTAVQGASRGEPVGELRLVDYTSDDEECTTRSPSHTGQQSLTSDHSRSLQQATRSALHQVASLRRPMQAPTGNGASPTEADSVAQGHVAVAEDAPEPAPPGVGSPAISGPQRPQQDLTPSHPLAVLSAGGTHATQADAAGSLQQPTAMLQDRISPRGPLQMGSARQAEHRPHVQQLQAPTQQQPIPQLQAPSQQQPIPQLQAASQQPTLQQQSQTAVQQTSQQLPASPAFVFKDSIQEDDTWQGARASPLHMKVSPMLVADAQPVLRPEAAIHNRSQPEGTEGTLVVDTYMGAAKAGSNLRGAQAARTAEAVRAAELRVGVLEALREMGAQHMTLAMMSQTGALKAVQALVSCQVSIEPIRQSYENDFKHPCWAILGGYSLVSWESYKHCWCVAATAWLCACVPSHASFHAMHVARPVCTLKQDGTPSFLKLLIMGWGFAPLPAMGRVMLAAHSSTELLMRNAL